MIIIIFKRDLKELKLCVNYIYNYITMNYIYLSYIINIILLKSNLIGMFITQDEINELSTLNNIKSL